MSDNCEHVWLFGVDDLFCEHCGTKGDVITSAELAALRAAAGERDSLQADNDKMQDHVNILEAKLEAEAGISDVLAAANQFSKAINDHDRAKMQAELDAARQRVAELERLKYEVIDIIAYDPRQRPSDEGDPSSELLGRLWDAVDKTEQPSDSKSTATDEQEAALDELTRIAQEDGEYD